MSPKLNTTETAASKVKAAQAAAWEIVRILADRSETLAVAESLTGGLVADWLTNVPGASSVLVLGVVSYTDQAKEQVLGVGRETLRRYSAVSPNVAGLMAEGVRRLAGNTIYAVATTGYAGPGGGTADDPVGTFYVGLLGPHGLETQRHHYADDRRGVKEVAAATAILQLLRIVRAG